MYIHVYIHLYCVYERIYVCIYIYICHVLFHIYSISYIQYTYCCFMFFDSFIQPHIAPNLTGFPAFYILFIRILLTTVY